MWSLTFSHWFSGWSKINYKIYDVINCLNKYLITHFVWYLEKEKRYDTETLVFWKWIIKKPLKSSVYFCLLMDKIVKKRHGTSDQSLFSYSKTFANFYKPIHDIVNYSAVTFFSNLESVAESME